VNHLRQVLRQSVTFEEKVYEDQEFHSNYSAKRLEGPIAAPRSHMVNDVEDVRTPNQRIGHFEAVQTTIQRTSHLILWESLMWRTLEHPTRV